MGVEVATELVVTMKLAEPSNPVTITEVGTPATAGFDDESATTSPLEAARPLRLTLPAAVTPFPPTTAFGFTDTALTVAGSTTRRAVCEAPLNVAVIVAVVEVATPAEVILKFTDVLPAGIVTVVGTLAFASLELRLMTTPGA